MSEAAPLFASIGSSLFFRKERESFFETLSMFLGSGMTVRDALAALQAEARSVRMKKLLSAMEDDLENGSSVYTTLEKSRLFPLHALALIRIGEHSGRLSENLKVVASEQEKEQGLRSKVRSAALYPLIVFGVAIVVTAGITVFILPKLANVFEQLHVKLPLISRVLLGGGAALANHGFLVMASVGTFMVALLVFFSLHPRARTHARELLFFIPGCGRLLRELELARLGSLLGTLMEAGLAVPQSLDALASATEFGAYQQFYQNLRDSVMEGNSFQKSFSAIKDSTRLIPPGIQQMIITGERSGTLAAALIKIGATFDARADMTTKNLSTLLEPLLLVCVWLGVMAVALAVILPIYALIGGLQTQ